MRQIRVDKTIRMSSSREDILREQLERTIREILKQLSTMKLVFQNPTYDLNKTVENELDFLLGFASILDPLMRNL